MDKYVALLVVIGCAVAAPNPGFFSMPVVAAAHAVAVAHSVPMMSYAAAPVVAAPAVAYAPAIVHHPATIITHSYAAAPYAYAAHSPYVTVH